MIVSHSKPITTKTFEINSSNPQTLVETKGKENQLTLYLSFNGMCTK